MKLLIFLFSIVSLSAQNQCIVCHKAESHYLGKGHVLKRWQSAASAVDRTGHAWIPVDEFKRFGRKFSAWEKQKESFYSTLGSKTVTEIVQVMRSELNAYDHLADKLEKGDSSVLEVLKNPFHSLQLPLSQKQSYRTTIESRIQKVLLVFGGKRERLEGVFEMTPMKFEDGIWSGHVTLDRWGAKKVQSSGEFSINKLGELIKLERALNSKDPLLQNCAWIFQRPNDLNMSPLRLERPIALETGRVLKQREMQARLTFETFELIRESNKIYMDISYSLSSAGTGQQVRLIGGKGTARVDLSGILQTAHAELDLSVRAFGVSMKARMEQWIELFKP